MPDHVRTLHMFCDDDDDDDTLIAQFVDLFSYFIYPRQCNGETIRHHEVIDAIHCVQNVCSRLW